MFLSSKRRKLWWVIVNSWKIIDWQFFYIMLEIWVEYRQHEKNGLIRNEICTSILCIISFDPILKQFLIKNKLTLFIHFQTKVQILINFLLTLRSFLTNTGQFKWNIFMLTLQHFCIVLKSGRVGKNTAVWNYTPLHLRQGVNNATFFADRTPCVLLYSIFSIMKELACSFTYWE